MAEELKTATNQEENNEKSERAKQREVCVKYVQKLHYDFFRAGAAKGFKNVKTFKERIRSLCDADQGGVWTAGQFLQAQLKVEQTSKNCRFRLEPDLYRFFLESVARRNDDLRECDLDTYLEDLEVARFISDSIPEEYRVEIPNYVPSEPETGN